MYAPLNLAIFSVLAAPAAAVEIDGKIDPAEWQGAQHVTDFRLTQPLSRAPASQPTEAWILATPEGLAIGFRNIQPPTVPRTRQHVQRDQDAQTDRVNLYIDFDGDGRTGYNFTVRLSNSIVDGIVTNENQFSTDWDANWFHATTEDEAGWSAEMLIPWHIAPMRDGTGEQRTLGIQLDRVVGATGERVAWPAISFNEQRFLTAFNKIEVPPYSQSLLAITPYMSGVHDFTARTDKNDFDAGMDVFWKPNGLFQLSATLNPDFGQVESDELVVNFGAVETFFNDKRPFFTENQGFFEVPFGSRNDNNRLIYTRRIGAEADDERGIGDVIAAIKLNGSAAGFNYGAFAATEANDIGRDFYALRVTRDGEKQGIGAMVTRVERPFFDRVADVYEIDHRWTPSDAWSIRTTVVGSEIKQAGIRQRDTGAQTRIDWDMGGGWRQLVYLLHTGRDLQLNDFGYLGRNNFNYGRYDLGRRFTDLPRGSAYASKDWHLAVSRRVNDSGSHIFDAVEVSRTGELRNGANDYFEVSWWTPGHNDLITRGNGEVKMPAGFWAIYEHERPQQGDSPWSFDGGARYDAEGLGGVDQGQTSLEIEPTYHASDRLSFSTGLELVHNPDWLLWRKDEHVLGTYRQNMIALSAGVGWLINDKQELRLKLEAIGLDADARQAWRVASNGTPIAVDTTVPDFGLRNMGFQIRYRYELAPLSYVYIAYVRGGDFYAEDFREHRVQREFRDSFELHDSEQLLLKLSYRFEL